MTLKEFLDQIFIDQIPQDRTLIVRLFEGGECLVVNYDIGDDGDIIFTLVDSD